MCFCMHACCLEIDLLSPKTKPLPPPHPPHYLPTPPRRQAPGTPYDRMSTQGRPRQQLRKPRPRTDATGNRKRGLCAPTVERKQRGGPQTDAATRCAPKDDRGSSGGSHGLEQI